MWVAHFAPGLAAKAFAPGVPLSLLALAGAIPDATFFVLNLIGLESWHVDQDFLERGCFPYATYYPFTHSLAGMAVIGVALTAGYSFLSERKVTMRDQAVLMLVVLSHFILELPAHREDVKITPTDNRNLGLSLFDRPAALFLLESAIFVGGLYAYTSFAPLATRSGYKTAGNMWRLWGVIGFVIIQQAHFCFGAAPTNEARWVHAPIFLFEILFTSLVIGKLES